MGIALLVVIWLITLISSYFFVAKTWWLPPNAAAHGGAIDSQFALTYIVMGGVFLAAQLGLGLVVWRHRDRGQRAQYSHGHTGMELTWTALTAVLFIGLNLMGYQMWAQNRIHDPQPDAVNIEVTGVQFAWYFRYPGPDGKFGRTKVELQDASAGNEAAIGLDPSDAAGNDDVVTSTLVMPVDRQVNLILRAQDVIHNFFIPAMRVKQDAVPGLMVNMHFTPIKTGDFEATCAELCGLGHYKMRAMTRVFSQPEYAAWLQERLAEKQQ